jgi:hypothetical protein
VPLLLRRSLLVPAGVLAVGLLVGGCGGDGGDDEATTTSSSTSTSTTVAPTTSAAPTTAPPAPSTTTAALRPGDPCELGSDPDCIDPDGTGTGTYLEGGADCLAAFPESPGLCTDLDGDGVAGYPDSG